MFDSNTQLVRCPYCESEYDPDEIQAETDATLENAAPSDGESAEDYITDGDGLRMYVCESCGGEIVTDETTAATSCPFCGNAVVLNGNLSGILKPDIVVPFKLDKQKAKDALMAFCSKKPLLPKGFMTENKIDEIKGVYVPFWLYSADADVSLSFKGTKTRAWSDFRYNYVETSYYRIVRDGSLGFADVPVDGSTKVTDTMMESIEPFDWSEAVDFNTAYLSGFFADKYNVSADECAERAEKRMKTSAEDAVKATVHGYATLTTEKSDAGYKNRSVRYGLLPVWLLTTEWKGTKYTFAMNGQTGKFSGKLPVAKGKPFLFFLLIALGVTALCTALSFLLL